MESKTKNQRNSKHQKNKFLLTPSTDNLLSSVARPTRQSLVSFRSFPSMKSIANNRFACVRNKGNSPQPQRGYNLQSVKTEEGKLNEYELLQNSDRSYMGFASSRHESSGNQYETSRPFQQQSIENQELNRFLGWRQTAQLHSSERQNHKKLSDTGNSRPTGFGCLPSGWTALKKR